MFEQGGGNVIASIDTETAAHTDDAVILSMGLCVADVTKVYTFKELLEKHTLFEKYDIKEQVQAGRSVDKDVWVGFWKNDKLTTEEARKVSCFPSKDDISIRGVGRRISAFLSEQSNGNCRDVEIFDRNYYDFWKIKHAIKKLDNEPEPWNYRHQFDITSMLKAWGGGRYANIHPQNVTGMIYHHPAHDAVLDWLRFQHQAILIGAIDKPEGYDLIHALYYKEP